MRHFRSCNANCTLSVHMRLHFRTDLQPKDQKAYYSQKSKTHLLGYANTKQKIAPLFQHATQFQPPKHITFSAVRMLQKNCANLNSDKEGSNQHPPPAIIFAEDHGTMTLVLKQEKQQFNTNSPQSISRNSILFLIVPFRSVASLSTF